MAGRRRNPGRTFDCPHCGEPVRRGAAACRACGSDTATGWSQDAELDLGSIPLGDEDFDYESWLARELEGERGREARRRLRTRILAGLVLAAMLIWLLAR